MLYLAGQRPPEEGAWLWITTADARRGGEFTALFLPRTRPRASGGDVLLHVAPGRGEGNVEQWPVPSARVRVWAVAAGSLILMAGWDRLDLDGWPERVRATAVFAVGVLRELQEHGADVRARDQVEVEAAAESAAAGFPGLPTWVTAGGDRRWLLPQGACAGRAHAPRRRGRARAAGDAAVPLPGCGIAWAHERRRVFPAR